MKNDFSLAISIVGFISAIFLCSFFKIGITFSFFLIFISAVLFLFRKFFVSNSECRRQIFLITIFILSFGLGVLRYGLIDLKPLDANLENNIGNKIEISGIISSEPEKTDKQQILTVDFKNIFISTSSVAVSGKGIVSTDLYPGFNYGDLIKIYGTLSKPENFSNSAGGASTTDDFDYISYLAKDDIYYKIDFAQAKFISSGHGNSVQAFLFKIKDAFIENLNKTIVEPEASFLGGILIGAKNSMDKDTTEILRKSGLSYIVVLSGYNITVVANAIEKTFSFLPRNIGFLGGVFGIILFVIMSGSSSTAIRAGIMALIVILADATHRNYQAGRALIFAGVLMVIFNPKILVFDLSFQLSFIATVAIIYVAPILENKFGFITEKFNLRSTISSTVSAQILVLPLILYSMGTLSLVAIPANIFVIASIPATMLFGFIAGMLGFLWLPLALPFAWISWIFLAYIINISKFFADLPFSSINIPWFSSALMALSYLIIFGWIFYEGRKQKHV